ncbi:MAG: hypothetical protein ABEJ72_01320 [Candidatus Aenigmatarchaeota archaeon]
MIGKLKQTFNSITGKKCQFCDEVIQGSDFVTRQVKVPGYVGTHEKAFCSETHLRKWREFVDEWESNNHEIPDSGKSCPTCGI